MKQDLPIEMPVVVTKRRGKPQIELRRRTTDEEIIRLLVEKAINREALVIVPRFTSMIESVSSLIQKDILYRDRETGELHFTEEFTS